MPEVQKHGFDFENWVKATFFTQPQASYTEKWDISIQANNSIKIPNALRFLPVSVKACKYGSPIGFGDALRQYNNHDNFLLIIGFWQQSGGYKNFVAVEGVKILTSDWKRLFLPLTVNDLEMLDSTIKNKDLSISEARIKAQEIKNAGKFTKTKIVLNPKINSDQRRLQCSLPFQTFWQEFANKAAYQNIDSVLFGKKVPNPFLSGRRTFKPKY
ncbi:MAG: hypothetical protein AAB336_04750 [Acidobacteriota bacterium]